MSKIKKYEIGKSKLIKDIRAQSKQGMKFCDSCMRWMPAIGGKNITSNDKMTYKWKCGKCLEDKNG